MALTGYKITEYIDVNPQSPSYGQTYTARTQDASCNPAAAQWVDIGSYCERLPDNRLTGYKITTQMDTNPASSSYTQTRETRTLSYPDCPLDDTSPIWVMCNPEDCPPYCETWKYPSGMIGETGIYRFTYYDENVYSPTFAESMESGFTVDDWTPEMEQRYGPFPCEAVNTDPQGEIISSQCVLAVDEYGVAHTTGMRDVTILDTNPYSDTYLTITSMTIADAVGCPTSNIYIFAFQEHTGTVITQSIEYDTRQTVYLLTSTKDSTDITYTVEESCDWLTYDKGSDYVTFFTQVNETAYPRTCEITMTQSQSGKVLKVFLTQLPAPNIEAFMSSDKYLLDALDTSASTSNFTFGYWGSENGTWTKSGVTYEEIPLNQGEVALPYEIVQSPIVPGSEINYKRCRFSGNTSNIERILRLRSNYKGKYSDIITIKQAAKNEEVIEDFTYITFVMKWTSSGGSDFDTATFVTDSGIQITPNYSLAECPVGSFCRGTDGYDDDLEEDLEPLVRPYLQHGGDTTQSGQESVLVNLQNISDAMGDNGVVNIELYGNWYAAKSNGQCEIEWHAYYGTDGMVKQGHLFVPTGDTFEVDSGTTTGVCRAFSSTNADAMATDPTETGKEYYSLLASFEYDLENKSCFFKNHMLSATGRDIRGYLTRNSTLIHGGPNEQVGSETLNYDSSPHDITIQYVGNFFNIINGQRKNAQTYVGRVQYYSVGGGVVQTGWCHDVQFVPADGILTLSIDANQSGRNREVDIILTGVCAQRNVVYRFAIIQSA